MLRGLERRLRRLEEQFDRLAAERDHGRDVLKARKIIAQAIRAGLVRAGLDPDKAPALRRLEQPDPPHPQTADRPAGSDGGPVDVFYGRLFALARRYRDKPPDLANASPAMLFAAYCIGDATPSPS